MTATTVRSRTFTAGGGPLAAAGLLATMAIGPAAFARTTPTEANAEVTSTITLTGATEFTLTGAPGDAEAATTTSALNAETNNAGGYNVTVLADGADLVPADPVANTDVVPVSSLKVLNADAAYAGLSTETPVTVHTQTDRSIEGGDALTASYQLTMPFVPADTYSGGLTLTATANG